MRRGITNALFKVARRGGGADASIVQTVVVRVFGKGTDRFITHRKVQGEACRVEGEHGFGAKVLGVFKNGLVEEFIEADSVAPEDLATEGRSFDGGVADATITQSSPRLDAAHLQRG